MVSPDDVFARAAVGVVSFWAQHRGDPGPDWLAFWSSVVSSTAWPLTVVAVALIFRRTLGKLLVRLRRFKAWDFEGEFEEGLVKAERTAADLPPETAPADGTIVATASRLPPSSAIVEAWLQVEVQLRLLAERRDFPRSRAANPAALIRYLSERKALDPDLVETLNQLRRLRNYVAHPNEGGITEDQAVRYAQTAAQVASALSSQIDNSAR